MDKSLVESKYVNTLLKCSYHQPDFIGTPHKLAWELDCPLCGGRKAKLVWMDGRNTFKFFCPAERSKSHCGFAGELQVLLKVWNRPLWVQYLQEREAEGTAGSGHNCPKASQVAPTRRSQRRLSWRKSKVPNQVSIATTDASRGSGWCSVDLTGLSQLSSGGRFGVVLPSRWTRSCRHHAGHRYWQKGCRAPLDGFIQMLSQMILPLVSVVVMNWCQDTSVDRHSRGVVPDIIVE